MTAPDRLRNEQLCSDLWRFVCVGVTSRFHPGVQTVSKHRYSSAPFECFRRPRFAKDNLTNQHKDGGVGAAQRAHDPRAGLCPWPLPPPRCRTAERACVSEAVLRRRPFGSLYVTIMSELCAGIREIRILFFDQDKKPALITRTDHVTLCVSSCASGLIQPDYLCLPVCVCSDDFLRIWLWSSLEQIL